MGTHVNIPQFFFGQVGIDLGRRQLFMSQKFLHTPQICPSVQEVGGKGMAEHMRMNVLVKFGFSFELVQYPAHGREVSRVSL